MDLNKAWPWTKHRQKQSMNWNKAWPWTKHGLENAWAWTKLGLEHKLGLNKAWVYGCIDRWFAQWMDRWMHWWVDRSMEMPLPSTLPPFAKKINSFKGAWAWRKHGLQQSVNCVSEDGKSSKLLHYNVIHRYTYGIRNVWSGSQSVRWHKMKWLSSGH